MSIFSKVTDGYQDLWKAIIRPPREQYQIKDLGPKQFRIQGVHVTRTDIQLKNKKKLKLECSWFEPVNRPCQQLPCVVYLHGNCSSRMESLPCLDVLIPQNITLFSLDTSGCGLSEGEYISLGWYERDDVEIVIDYLRQSNKVSTIGLWGRSMGAVTSLMHADRDPSIAGLVLDSPFSSLRSLAEDLCKQYSKIPKFVMSAALSMIKSTVKDKANFDINDLDPLKNHVTKAFIPALFIYAKEDSFIQPKHTLELYQNYAGDKNLVKVDGDHNSPRPQFCLDSVGIFFFNTLQVKELVPIKEENKNQQGGQNKGITDFNVHNVVRKIGNEDLVQNALNDFDDDDEFNKAIEESLKISQQQNKQQDQVENQKQEKLPKKQDEEEKLKLEEYFINDQQIQPNIEEKQLKPDLKQSEQQQLQQMQQDLINFDSNGENKQQNQNKYPDLI